MKTYIRVAIGKEQKTKLQDSELNVLEKLGTLNYARIPIKEKRV